jgi:dihydrofolate synthase/folylpolyglutamate synthase
MYDCVHIAGTNGKGSIASMVASVLSRAGYKVGLYTSPHLVHFNERIRINGAPIADEEVVRAAEAVRRIYTQSDPPTFFECATAMALYHFAQEAVDWAVLETGMGGRFDATNVVTPRACVISNVTLEHTEYLGIRLEDIAEEKAGIIKPGVPAVTGVRQRHALAVIEKTANRAAAPLRRLGKEIRVRQTANGTFHYVGDTRQWRGLTVGLSGSHQVQNAGLALGALEFLQEKGLILPDEAVYAGLREVSWPGRLEIVCHSPLVLLDGAHNPGAVGVLERFLRTQTDPGVLTMVVGILRDKAWRGMLRRLAALCNRMILTRPQYERADDPAEQARFVRNYHGNVEVIPRIDEAIAFALDTLDSDAALCITGSLYTIGEAKAYLERRQPICRHRPVSSPTGS